MKSEVDVVSQFDSCVKKFLSRELKYRTRTIRRQQKRYISISEMSFTDQVK